MTREQARALLRDRGLRATSPRVAVVVALANSERPLSYSELVLQLRDTDCYPATIFRNLVKLRDSGVAPVVSRAGGQDRYVLAPEAVSAHRHPHFECNRCGRVECLPCDLALTGAPWCGLARAWTTSLETATIQLSGTCPDCIDTR